MLKAIPLTVTELKLTVNPVLKVKPKVVIPMANPTVPDLKLVQKTLAMKPKALMLTVNLRLKETVKMQKAIMPEVSDLKVLKVTVLPMKQTVTVAIPKPMLMKLTVKALNLKVIVPAVKMPDLTVKPAVLQAVHLHLVVCH